MNCAQLTVRDAALVLDTLHGADEVEDMQYGCNRHNVMQHVMVCQTLPPLVAPAPASNTDSVITLYRNCERATEHHIIKTGDKPHRSSEQASTTRSGRVITGCCSIERPSTTQCKQVRTRTAERPLPL